MNPSSSRSKVQVSQTSIKQAQPHLKCLCPAPDWEVRIKPCLFCYANQLSGKLTKVCTSQVDVTVYSSLGLPQTKAIYTSLKPLCTSTKAFWHLLWYTVQMYIHSIIFTFDPQKVFTISCSQRQILYGSSNTKGHFAMALSQLARHIFPRAQDFCIYQHSCLHILQLGSKSCPFPILSPAPSADTTTCSIISKAGSAKTRPGEGFQLSGYLTPTQLNSFLTQQLVALT